MIITIANAKGGVGKTTSAIHLAAAWTVRTGRTARVLDADVQASASLWADLAERNGEDMGLIRVDAANRTTLERLRRSPEAVEGMWIVDAPPQGAVLASAVSVADFVLVPAAASPLDLQQAWATIEDVPAGIPAAVLLVRAERRTRAYRDALMALDEQGTPRFEDEHMVAKRQELVTAMGHAPTRLFEYGGVLDEILQVMGGGASCAI